MTKIDLIFDSPERVREFTGLPISTQTNIYKERIYSIAHSGYNLLTDSQVYSKLLNTFKIKIFTIKL